MEKFLAVHEKSRRLVNKKKVGNIENLKTICLLLATHLKIMSHNLVKQFE